MIHRLPLLSIHLNPSLSHLYKEPSKSAPVNLYFKSVPFKCPKSVPFKCLLNADGRPYKRGEHAVFRERRAMRTRLQGATRLEPLGDQNEVQGADARPRVSELSAAGTQPGAAGSPPV